MHGILHNTFGKRKTRGLCVFLHECWSVWASWVGGETFGAQRVKFTRNTELSLQNFSSPHNKTQHAWHSLVLCQSTHACIKTICSSSNRNAQLWKVLPLFSGIADCIAVSGAQSKRRLFKSISCSAKPAPCGLYHLWFCSSNNLLIALMLPPVEELGNFKPLHCSGFPIMCKLGSSLTPYKSQQRWWCTKQQWAVNATDCKAPTQTATTQRHSTRLPHFHLPFCHNLFQSDTLRRLDLIWKLHTDPPCIHHALFKQNFQGHWNLYNKSLHYGCTVHFQGGRGCRCLSSVW